MSDITDEQWVISCVEAGETDDVIAVLQAQAADLDRLANHQRHLITLAQRLEKDGKLSPQEWVVIDHMRRMRRLRLTLANQETMNVFSDVDSLVNWLRSDDD